MFNHSTDGSRDADSSGHGHGQGSGLGSGQIQDLFSQFGDFINSQPWSRFGLDLNPNPNPSPIHTHLQDHLQDHRSSVSTPTGAGSHLAQDRHFDDSASASGMDWTQSLVDVDAGFHQNHDSLIDVDAMSIHDSVDLDHMGPMQARGGVGRLVAQFENKTTSPPLPPRPMHPTSHPTSHPVSHQVSHSISHSAAHQATPSVATTPPITSQFGSFNSGVSAMNHVTSPLATSPPTSSYFGSFNANGSTNIASPITTSTDPTSYGSFGGQSRVASPMAASPPPMPFGSFNDRVASPGASSSSGNFGNLDHFMAHSRMGGALQTGTLPPPPMIMPMLSRSMTSSSMASNHMTSTSVASTPVATTPSHNTPGVPGTPGFEIWRPPPSMTPKAGPPQASTPSTPDGGGYFKPPVPTTPKPVINTGSQFILEFNPSATARAKGKAPAKPPRPRLPPRLPPRPTPSMSATFSPEVKDEPSISLVPDSQSSPALSAVAGPQRRGSSVSLRPQTGTRPSREQVPAEAWELYKPTIRTLYLEERKPLKEVMAVMADKYGFQATPKMYKTRFSQWGFVKNNTEDEVKRLLSMKFQRDAEGKVSEFVRNGRVVNLGTYLKRKGVTEYDLVDFELPANLPEHIRCRTPTPPLTPEYLRSPDLLRAQELVIGNMRKAFLQCRQFEVETDTQIGWPSVMIWGTGSSDLLLEANFYFEAMDADQGGHYLMMGFKQLEEDLKRLSPQGINEVLWGMVHRDAGMMTALCKYVAAFSTTNLERSHPLRQIFACLYEVQQKHGSQTLSDLLWATIPTIAEELEAIYGRRHPYVARTWTDLALFYNHVNAERLEKLAAELRVLQRQVEQSQGATSVDALVLRYTTVQLLWAANQQSDATRQAATDLWNALKSAGSMFAMRDSRPNVYCYHSPLKVDPWTKRCRRRYDCLGQILEAHVNVKIHPYFEEDFHTAEHAPDSQDAWAAAMEQMTSTTKWSFI